MKTHVVTPSAHRPFHQTGELVWATVGNYLEDRNCRPKPRPCIILEPGDCQYWVAGLTTQPTFKTTAAKRVPMPSATQLGLEGPCFLWSARPSRLCRIDVRTHIGWITREMVQALAPHIQLPYYIRDALYTAAREHAADACPS